MASDPSAILDLDDVLNDLGFDEKNIQSEDQQNIAPRRGTVVASGEQTSQEINGAPRQSTRVNNRAARQSNLFSASSPLGVNPETSARNSLFITPSLSNRGSLQVNKTEEKSSDIPPAADPFSEPGNRRSIYDPDHLELPDFRKRDSMAYDRPKTV